MIIKKANKNFKNDELKNDVSGIGQKPNKTCL